MKLPWKIRFSLAENHELPAVENQDVLAVGEPQSTIPQPPTYNT